MAMTGQFLKVGVYVDVSNLTQSGGYGMQYDILRDFSCRGGGVPTRLNAYLAYDPERAREDPAYGDGQRRFQDMLREQGFKVVLKQVKWYQDEAGNRVGKSNADIDMAVDALLQSEVDRVVLCTGDGDFVKVVSALQNRGCRVEVVAFSNVSADLRREADMFMSGYLIPGLLPVAPTQREFTWGTPGSRVRGLCYFFNSAKRFGFFRFLQQIDARLWDVDSRKSGSPYGTAFFHVSDLPAEVNPEGLPRRDMIFEFTLAKSARASNEGAEGSFQAQAIEVVKGQS